MNNNTPKRGWTEELEIAASELVDRVKELIAEGNVRRLIIRKPQRRNSDRNSVDRRGCCWRRIYDYCTDIGRIRSDGGLTRQSQD